MKSEKKGNTDIGGDRETKVNQMKALLIFSPFLLVAEGHKPPIETNSNSSIYSCQQVFNFPPAKFIPAIKRVFYCLIKTDLNCFNL